MFTFAVLLNYNNCYKTKIAIAISFSYYSKRFNNNLDKIIFKVSNGQIIKLQDNNFQVRFLQKDK